MPGPRAVQHLQMPHSRDWQGGQMPRSCPGGGGLGAGGIDWCIIEHACSVKGAGYWTLFAFLSSSNSSIKTQQQQKHQNLVDIQRSCSRFVSIAYTLNCTCTIDFSSDQTSNWQQRICLHCLCLGRHQLSSRHSKDNRSIILISQLTRQCRCDNNLGPFVEITHGLALTSAFSLQSNQVKRSRR